MAWTWIENGNIFVSDSKDIATKDIAIEVPDGTLPQDLTIENGNIVFKTEAKKTRRTQELCCNIACSN